MLEGGSRDMRGYLDLIIIGVVVLAVVGYTAYQRHDATVAANNKSLAETTVVTHDAIKVKNEIRNRPVSDALTIGRLRAGSW